MATTSTTVREAGEGDLRTAILTLTLSLIAKFLLYWSLIIQEMIVVHMNARAIFSVQPYDGSPVSGPTLVGPVQEWLRGRDFCSSV